MRAIMPTSRECVCCCEIDQVILKKEESANRITNITEHEEFDSVCLNVWMLQAANFNNRYHYGLLHTYNWLLGVGDGLVDKFE